MTSHLDLVPTLLPEVLGCSNPTQDYSVGTSIWKEAGRRDWVYSTGWSRDAFVEPHRIVLINAAGALEFLDKTYRPTKDRTIPPYLSEVLKEIQGMLNERPYSQAKFFSPIQHRRKLQLSKNSVL